MTKTEGKHTVTTLEMPDDYEGKVIVTMLSMPSKQKSEKAILYIHGYLDYYFQTHMAEYFTERGKNFYAIDLRKYGRSFLPGQHFNYCRHMEEYYADIDAAIEHIVADGNADITLMGHSTGGLLSALYAGEGNRRNLISRVILNSPFLEFNTNWFTHSIAIPVVSSFAVIAPYGKMKSPLSPNYFKSIHTSYKGEWDFDTEMKPEASPPLYFAWMRAIRLGHRKIKRGLNITAPVLVMFSGKSTYHRQWHEEAAGSDTVLNVKHIMKYGMRLGDNVTLAEIDNGLHDLVLSRPEVRNKVLAMMDYYIEGEQL